MRFSMYFAAGVTAQDLLCTKALVFITMNENSKVRKKKKGKEVGMAVRAFCASRLAARLTTRVLAWNLHEAF